MSIAPYETADPPPWVSSRAAAWNRMTASGIAQPTSVEGSAGAGTVYNISVKDGSAAAQKLARIHNANDLTLDAPVAAISQSISIAQPIGKPFDPDAVGGPQGPVPFVPMRQDPDGISTEQGGSGPSSSPSGPTAPAPQQPATVPPTTAPAGSKPSVFEQMYIPGTTVGSPGTEMRPFIPVPDPKPEPVVNPDPLAFPDTSGHKVGDQWDEPLPGGLTKKYTIPEGNGTNTVDVVVVDATGTVVNNARVAAVEGGPGYVRWQDDPSGFSSYYNTADPSQGGYGLNFVPGMSTSGTGREFQVGPNGQWVRTGSYDMDGNLVGYDTGFRNQQGLYDNTHTDLLGFQTLIRTTRDPQGGLASEFVGQLDKSGRGWVLDENGRPAERFLDGNHREVIISADPVTGKQTVSYAGGKNTYDSEGSWLGHLDIGPNGTILGGWSKAAWYSKQLTEYHLDLLDRLREEIVDPITGSRGEITYLGDRTKITYNDGSVVVLDKNGKPIDTRSLSDKATSAALNFSKGAGRSALGMIQGLSALAGINDAINQGGQLFGFHPNLTTKMDAFQQIDLGIGHMLLADLTAVVGTTWGAYESLTGQQSWGKTWDNAWDAGLNSYNERSKFLIGTDWTGFSEHPAETLGAATVGIGSWLVPSKIPGRPRGNGTPIASKPAPTKPVPRTHAPAQNAKEVVVSGDTNAPSSMKAPNWIVDQAQAIPVEAYQRQGFGTPLHEVLRTEADIAHSSANMIVEIQQRLQLESRVPQPQRATVTAHTGAPGSSPGARGTGPSASAGGTGTGGGTAAHGIGSRASSAPVVRVGSGGPPPARTGPMGTGGPPAPPAHMLPGYKPPAAFNGPAEKLSKDDFRELLNPFPGGTPNVAGALRLPKLKPNTRYEISSGKLKTIIVTKHDGTPEFIDTWGSRSSTGTATGRIKYNPLLRNGIPNVVYRVNGDLHLRANEYGMIVEGYGPELAIVEKRTRSEHMQRTFNAARGAISGAIADAGHIFRVMFGSPAEHLFYTPQRAKVNQGGGQFYIMEDAIKDLLKSHENDIPPGRVEYMISIEYNRHPSVVGVQAIGDERVPLKYHVQYRLVGTRRWQFWTIDNI